MKINLMSDLHFEFLSKTEIDHFFTQLPDSDVMILAGDIDVGRHNIRNTLKRFAAKYPHVIYVMGNHEPYNSSIYKFRQLDGLANNVHFLDPGSVQIDDVTFIGGTLWTNFQNDPIAEMAALSGITDFHRVHEANPQLYKTLYQEHLAYIQDQIANTEGRKIVVTHFLPTNSCVHPKYGNNLLNKYFANDLDSYIESLTDVTWCFGHTHDSIEVVVGDTLCLANPYGYNAENKNFRFDYEVQ